jgi:polysaccharide export outer membrane protein
MAPVRVVRAFRLPVIAAMTALALSGCMRRNAPVAVAPQPSLDNIAYGRTVAVPGPVAVPVVYAAPAPMPVPYDAPYHLDAGDRLRVVVYGQEGLTNTYSISAGGTITMPLIGSVPARGRTPSGLAADIAARLRNGFIREPSVAVEIEAYRPFFILGEVQAPGQYPYVPNMTAESAVAIAAAFPRAPSAIA